MPRDLYYHEAAYVRRLEALVLKGAEYIANLESHEGAEGFSESTRVLEADYNKLVQEHKEKSNV